MTYSNDTNYEENGGGQDHQPNRNGRKPQTLSHRPTATVPTFLQRFDDASENLQAMQERTDEHTYAIAGVFYKGQLTRYGLTELVLAIAEDHQHVRTTTWGCEAEVAGTPVYDDIAAFNRELEAIVSGQYRDLLKVVGATTTRIAGKTTEIIKPKKEDKQGGGLGLFGWKSKEKIIVERVPMDRPGTIVPGGVLFEE